MKDSDIRHDVQGALERNASIDASAIAVAVNAGVVTLCGDVRTYLEKHAAERVALRVYGVNAVADELAVRAPEGHDPTDTEIAQALVDALTWNPMVPLHQVRVVVADGWVTLSGTLEWEYQRVFAERSAGKLTGVRGVSNTIVLKAPEPSRPQAESPERCELHSHARAEAAGC
jgi:osmotically-inducible protein OsmY